MVDADDGGNLPVEFFAEPFGETSASPVPAWTGRWQNLRRFAGTVGHEYADALARGVGGLRARVVSADVAVEVGHIHRSMAAWLNRWQTTSPDNERNDSVIV